MKLSQPQLSLYEEQGFLFLPELFSLAEIGVIRSQLPGIFSTDSPRRIMEKDGVTVRSVYGSHVDNEIMKNLVRHPRLLEPGQQIIANQVYIHQFKINNKAAFVGDVWEWHQDYIFWLKEDGIPACELTNAVIFLDEVNDFNGPLLLIPASHHENLIDVQAKQNLSLDGNANVAWISNLTADLKYTLQRPTISRLVSQHGIVAPKGPAGSVLFFHPNIVHGSSPNMSPFDRALLLITYNSVENVPVPLEKQRPDFLASRDYSTLVSLGNDILLPEEAAAFVRK